MQAGHKGNNLRTNGYETDNQCVSTSTFSEPEHEEDVPQLMKRVCEATECRLVPSG